MHAVQGCGSALQVIILVMVMIVEGREKERVERREERMKCIHTRMKSLHQ